MVGEKNGSTNLLAGGTVGGGRLLHEGGGLLATGQVAALGTHQDLLTAGLAHDARSATAGLETHHTVISFSAVLLLEGLLGHITDAEEIDHGDQSSQT